MRGPLEPWWRGLGVKKLLAQRSGFPVAVGAFGVHAFAALEPRLHDFEGANVVGVDPDQLAYFAASIFWRASAHDWKFMRRNPKRLKLGPYEEELRGYLLGGAFPANSTLVVAVTSGMERLRNMMMTFPFYKNRDTGFRHYRFTIPGITFQLFLGKDMPRGLRMLGCVHTPQRHILMTPDADDLNMSDAAKMISKTRKVGALKTR